MTQWHTSKNSKCILIIGCSSFWYGKKQVSVDHRNPRRRSLGGRRGSNWSAIDFFPWSADPARPDPAGRPTLRSVNPSFWIFIHETATLYSRDFYWPPITYSLLVMTWPIKSWSAICSRLLSIQDLYLWPLSKIEWSHGWSSDTASVRSSKWPLLNV